MKKISGAKGRALRAYCYLRLSVDKEDGKAQSIDAQRSAVHAYAKLHGIQIVEDFIDMGLSGQTDRRPEFRRMVEQATGDAHPVDLVLMYAFSRIARNMRLFFNTLGDLEDAGVEVRSTTEDFGQGRGKRLGRAMTAMMAEQQAYDASLFTRKSRRENARQGFWNGGCVPFGYRTFVARKDGEKSRMKLEVVPDEAAVVRRIFDWAGAGRGGRWIVARLNEEGVTLRGARFSNSNLSGILGREHYTGSYRDRTADDDGIVPDPEEAIVVECPEITDRARFEAVQALRASRNPRRTAPHVSAGTTLLTGVASCGMSGCKSGMVIRTGKGGQYSYYACNARVNKGGTCSCPSIRREQLDGIVLDLIEREILAPERLRTLLAGILQLSDERRSERQAELVRARADQTRLRTAIDRLLVAVEEGAIGPRDPIFAERMAVNQTALASATSRIDALETQLARGPRRITETKVDRFGALLAAKLRDDDPVLRAAYLRMFVGDVSVSDKEIVISGPTAALETGASSATPRTSPAVPSFDRGWCPEEDSNLHDLAIAST